METTIYTDRFDQLKFTTMVFSGGEVQVRLMDDSSLYRWIVSTNLKVIIQTNLINSNKIMELLLLTDALRRKGIKKIHLTCPYLPYARQDRVCYPGEALSLKVMTDIINSQNYETVEVWDAHSDVSLALINNVINVEAKDLLCRWNFVNDPIFVAPDTGAQKRVMNCAKHFGRSMITAEKVRDPNTGEITSTKVHVPWEHCNNKDFLIIDDICDGGRTFIELAKELKKLTTGEVNLYVIHGIFSKGFDVFKGLINNIYVANCFINHNNLPYFVFTGESKL